MKFEILAVIIVYLALLLGFVFAPSRNAGKNLIGYFLGGRSLPAWRAGFSSAVSSRGSWIFLGITTQAYIFGLSSLWLAAGLLTGDLLMQRYIGPAIQKRAHSTGAVSIPQLISAGFRETGSSLMLIITVPLLFFILCFVTAQLLGGSRVLFAFLGLTDTNGVIITGTIVITAVFFGGFRSLISSDLLNGALMAVSLIVLPLIIMIYKEGPANIKSDLISSDPYLWKLIPSSVIAVPGMFLTGLTAAGLMQVNTKFMALHPDEGRGKMVLTNFGVNLLIISGALFTGIFSRSYFPDSDSVPGADPENIFVGITGLIGNPYLTGLLTVAVLASVVSCAGSLSMVCSTAVIYDLMGNPAGSRKKRSEKSLIFYGRTAGVIILYICIVAAVMIRTKLNELFLFAMAGMGAALGPALIFSLFSRRLTRTGLKAGIIAGCLGVLLWKSFPVLSEAVNELIPATVLSVLAILAGDSAERKITRKKFTRQASYHEIKKGGYTN